jgi:hypothetical protein
MNDSLIPVSDRGEARITEAQLVTMRLPDLKAAMEVLQLEADVRGLALTVEDEFPSGDVIVKWWPRGETR